MRQAGDQRRLRGPHQGNPPAAAGLRLTRCRDPFARNLLQRVPKDHQGIVTAALRSVFAQEDASEIASRWDGLANSLAERFPRAPELMLQAKEDVLAFRHFPQPHWKKCGAPICRNASTRRSNAAPASSGSSRTTPRSPAWWGQCCQQIHFAEVFEHAAEAGLEVAQQSVDPAELR